ncbi:dUTP diphosphatase [Paucisalibacillus globulus]|uniref:dUTP diphosphatase n=1 Tax=Paucisalibacillus globulus TaxID=351095 RepID=UPI00041A450D|nr:dUTP diphosphatase [Paucisalibacillus globulus]
MNLQYLFEIQAGLDAHIEEEHPRQEGEDRLAKKILALQVELGELANEWRGFKFWKVNQQPVTFRQCDRCNGLGWYYIPVKNTNQHLGDKATCDCVENPSNPLLEEYVDCLHFILSIGLELGIREIPFRKISRTDLVFVFSELFEIASKLRNVHTRRSEYQWLISEFVKLGEMLDFTWEQIEQAYLEKNKVNHERQVNGY